MPWWLQSWEVQFLKRTVESTGAALQQILLVDRDCYSRSDRLNGTLGKLMPQLPLMASVGKSSPSPVLAVLLGCCSQQRSIGSVCQERWQKLDNHYRGGHFINSGSILGTYSESMIYVILKILESSHFLCWKGTFKDHLDYPPAMAGTFFTTSGYLDIQQRSL